MCHTRPLRSTNQYFGCVLFSSAFPLSASFDARRSRFESDFFIETTFAMIADPRVGEFTALLSNHRGCRTLRILGCNRKTWME